MKWNTIAALFRRQPRGAQAALRMALAYKNLFKPNDPEAQIVLADMAAYCQFYWHNGPGTEPGDRAFVDGKRAAFGRLFHFLAFTDEDLAALAQAAKAEAGANTESDN